MTELAARAAGTAPARPDDEAALVAPTAVTPPAADAAAAAIPAPAAAPDAETNAETDVASDGSATAAAKGNAAEESATAEGTTVADGAAVTDGTAVTDGAAATDRAADAEGATAVEAAAAVEAPAVAATGAAGMEGAVAVTGDDVVGASAAEAALVAVGTAADVKEGAADVEGSAADVDGSADTDTDGASGGVEGGRAPRRIPVPRLRLAIAFYAVSLIAFWISPLGHHWNFVDIFVYRQGGLAVLHGQGLYIPSFNDHQLPFTYPPISAVLFTGLGLLSVGASQAFATVCNLLLLPIVLRFALRIQPFPRWLSGADATRLGIAAAGAAVWFEPMWTTLRYGQINVLIAALIVFDLCRPNDRRTKGVTIGIAAGLKMTPLIFIVYLAATRRYRAAATALGAFVATIAVSFAVVPTDARIYWTQDVLDASRPGKVESAANQTLRGALSRLMHTENVQNLWLLAAVVVTAAGVFLAVRAQRRGENEASGFALCALTGLLVSPISWTHHWVEAIPALMLVALKAYRDRSTPLLVGCVLAAILGYSQITWRVPMSGFTGNVELSEHGFQLVLSNAYVIGGLVALVWAAVAAWRSRTARGSRAATATATMTAAQTATAVQAVTPATTSVTTARAAGSSEPVQVEVG